MENWPERDAAGASRQVRAIARTGAKRMSGLLSRTRLDQLERSHTRDCHEGSHHGHGELAVVDLEVRARNVHAQKVETCADHARNHPGDELSHQASTRLVEARKARAQRSEHTAEKGGAEECGWKREWNGPRYGAAQQLTFGR